MKCKDCKNWEKEYGWDVACEACPDGSYHNKLNVHTVDTVHFPSLGAVSATRVKEMERRVILPYDKPGGGYYLGRKMENGKVSENKQPDYRP